MSKKETKEGIDKLKNQSLDSDKVIGGKTLPFNEFVETKDKQQANYLSDEKTTIKSRFNKKGDTAFQRKTDAKK